MTSLPSDSCPYPVTMHGRVLRRCVNVMLAFGVGLVASYVVLWVGGAAEIVFHDEPPTGDRCSVAQFLSVGPLGYEAARWRDGGLLGTPGRVCVVHRRDEDLLWDTPRRIDGQATFGLDTWSDNWSLLIAVLALVMVGVETYDGLDELDERIEVLSRR